MSDKHDEEVKYLGEALIRCYLVVAGVCMYLPVPISLPKGPLFDSQELIPAVARVVDLIEDQPVSTELKTGVFTGCLFWLAAAKLFARFVEQGGDPTAKAELELILIAAGEALNEAIGLLE
ncbi:hypothetical protein ACWEPZ_02865 [Streptomyces sp. NPDC004288]